jgi:succinate dehydrogenase / fumarate reductase cytochrome b subunit
MGMERAQEEKKPEGVVVRTLRNLPGFWRASLNPWLIRVRNHPERLAFVLHRVTGAVIAFYLIAHIFVTDIPAYHHSWANWESLMATFSKSAVNKVGEFIIAGCVFYHGINGIRLLLTEFFGVCIGKPERPIPPYITPTAKSCQRKLLYLVFILTAIFWVLSGLVIFGVLR